MFPPVSGPATNWEPRCVLCTSGAARSPVESPPAGLWAGRLEQWAARPEARAAAESSPPDGTAGDGGVPSLGVKAGVRWNSRTGEGVLYWLQAVFKRGRLFTTLLNTSWSNRHISKIQMVFILFPLHYLHFINIKLQNPQKRDIREQNIRISDTFSITYHLNVCEPTLTQLVAIDRYWWVIHICWAL